jgi:hypothetical protein
MEVGPGLASHYAGADEMIAGSRELKHGIPRRGWQAADIASQRNAIAEIERCNLLSDLLDVFA